MTGWNLPPGVNVSDIPGNRPEDEAEERFWEDLDTNLSVSHPDEWKLLNSLFEDGNVEDAIFVYARMARDMAYSRGYQDGIDDANQAAIEEETNVLGKCRHGVDLDREFCPEGCRV